MSVTGIVTAVANGATAIGVGLLVVQVKQNARAQRAEFERGFVDRYQGVIARVPFAELVGRRDTPDMENEAVARAYFDYFE